MKIVLVGGRGFLGSAVAKNLFKHEVVTVDRSPGDSTHQQADILDTKRLTSIFAGAQAVVNFVGLSPLKQPSVSYQKIHVDGTKSVCEAAKKAGVKQVVYISALGVSNPQTIYLRTKLSAEQLLKKYEFSSLIIRPSVLFDTNSEFVEMIQKFSWTRMFPNIQTHVQPVYRQELAEWIAKALVDKTSGTYEFGGPQVLSIVDIAQLLYSHKGHSMLRLPSWTARLGANLLAKLPSTHITTDQVRSLDLNNVLKDSSDAQQRILSTSLFDWVVQST